MVAAVGAGDLALAGEIAMTGLEVAWLQVTSSLKEAWLQFVDYLYQPWQAAVDWITDALLHGFYGIQSVWASVTTSLMSAWDIFISYAERAWQHFSSFFQQLWADMVAIVDQEASDKLTTAVHQQKLDFENRKSNADKTLDAKLGQNNTALQQQRADIQAQRDAMRRTLDEDRQRRDEIREKPNATIEAKNKRSPPRVKSWQGFQSERRTYRDSEFNSTRVSSTRTGTCRSKHGQSLGHGYLLSFAALSIGGDLGSGSPLERTARASEKTAKNTEAIKKQGRYVHLMTIEITESYESQEITRSYDEESLEIKAPYSRNRRYKRRRDSFLQLARHPSGRLGCSPQANQRQTLGGGFHEAAATYYQSAPEVVKTVRYRTTGQTMRIVQGYGRSTPPP